MKPKGHYGVRLVSLTDSIALPLYNELIEIDWHTIELPYSTSFKFVPQALLTSYIKINMIANSSRVHLVCIECL